MFVLFYANYIRMQRQAVSVFIFPTLAEFFPKSQL